MIGIVAISMQAAAAFAPPLGTPIRVTIEAERNDSGTATRFASAKRVIFAREGDGFRGEVMVEPGTVPDADAQDPAAMFAAAMARLAGRKLVFHLDRQGRVTGMDDQVGAWAALMHAIAALPPTGAAPDDRARAARMQAVTRALGQLPPERQRAILGSMLGSLIAADVVGEGAGPPTAVRVPATSMFGAVQLDGLRSVSEARGVLEVAVSATGPVSFKGPDGMVAGTMALETLRRIDPATGLLLESRETVRTVLPDGSLTSERTTITRVNR